MAGVPTVRIHQITNEVQGLLTQVGGTEYFKFAKASSVYDYIKSFYQGKAFPKLPEYDLRRNWLKAEECFQKHLSMLEKASKEKSYFDFSQMNLTKKERISRLAMSLFGMRIHNMIWG